MAYSTNSDVRLEFKAMTLNSSTSSILDTTVDGFIAQADALINSKIGLKYVVPVTGAESLKILKTISIYLVADRMAKILQVKTITEENQTAEKSLRDIAMEMIKDIIDGILLLSDATLKSSGHGFNSFAVDNDLDYTFKKATDQW